MVDFVDSVYLQPLNREPVKFLSIPISDVTAVNMVRYNGTFPVTFVDLD